MLYAPRELTLRLAWYLVRYGEIPEPELRKLWLGATLVQKNDETSRIIELADQIYFASADNITP